MTDQPFAPQQTLAMGLQASKDDAQLVTWVQSQYNIMKSARSRIINQWNLNLAFYQGKQYYELNSLLGGKLYVPKAPPHRIRLTINRIRPMVRTEFARVTQQKPNASVIPSTTEDEDLQASYAAEQIWEFVSRQNHAQREYRLAAWWMLITGTGFMKTWWDPNIGPMSDPQIDPYGNITPPMRMGDVCFAAVTPYHLFVPDLRTTTIQDQPFILNAYPRSVAWLQQFYGMKLDGLNVVPDTVTSNDILDASILNLQTSNAEPNSVMCFELWAKPGAHKLLPNGGMLQIIGDQIVSGTRDGIPYQHEEYPFTKFDHIPTGTFYSESSIFDLRPLQKEYNRTRSQVTEAKNRMGKPQLVAAKGSIQVNKITSEPGQVIEYKVGLPPPQPMTLMPLPNYIIEEQDRILSDFEDISGQHAVSTGSAPPGVTAATAISYLQEKDDGILSHTYDSIEEGWENIAYQTLNLVVQYWTLPRMVKTNGADGAFDTLLLQGSDLKDNTDIRMEGGSALPVSKSARQAFLMDMMKMGFISPQDGLKLLDMGGVQKLYEMIRRDESQAQRENIKMKRANPQGLSQFQQEQSQQNQTLHDLQQQKVTQDQTTDPHTGMPLEGAEVSPPQDIPPPPMEPYFPTNTWDNHQVHVDTHNNFRKTQEFELLQQPIKDEFEAHVQMHIAAINQAMVQVAQATGEGMSPDAASSTMGAAMPAGQGPPPMPGGQ